MIYLIKNFILILIIFLVINIFKEDKKEYFGNFKRDCKSNIPKAIKLVIDKRNMKNDDSNWDYFLPCSYTNCEQDIIKFKDEKTGKKIFMIDGCDTFASKVKLWEFIKIKYMDKASEIMPQTFILKNEEDMNEFKEFYYYKKQENSKCKFILKNFKQRQEGLKLVDNLKDIRNGIKDDFKIVQDYLEDPFLISGRKINIRVYVLVVCHKGTVGAWIYNDGFIYYTPKEFEKFSMDKDKTITTGYIDRKVYDENPLSTNDLRKMIGKEKSDKLDNSIKTNINKVIESLSGFICLHKDLSKHVRFQIFGADMAPDEELNVKLMEFNKGPDIGFKDDKDGKIKKNMIKDAFDIIEPSGSRRKNNFYRVY